MREEERNYRPLEEEKRQKLQSLLKRRRNSKPLREEKEGNEKRMLGSKLYNGLLVH